MAISGLCGPIVTTRGPVRQDFFVMEAKAAGPLTDWRGERQE